MLGAVRHEAGAGMSSLHRGAVIAAKDVEVEENNRQR
jgi:hypothetical protein